MMSVLSFIFFLVVINIILYIIEESIDKKQYKEYKYWDQWDWQRLTAECQLSEEYKKELRKREIQVKKANERINVYCLLDVIFILLFIIYKIIT